VRNFYGNLSRQRRLSACTACSRCWLTLLCLAFFWPASSLAAHLVPTLEQQQLGVSITDARLPRALRDDLRSGLTTRILIKVELLQHSKPVAHRDVEIALKYDLWDESFAMTMSVDAVVVMSKTYNHLDDVIAMLSHLSVPGLFPAARLAGEQELVIAAQLLFNPLDKERMEEIRKWVTENSRPAPADVPGASGGMAAPPPPSDSRTLFDRIFEQYAAGASVAAAFVDSATSKPFRMEELANEK
jgi:hypothetical protein